ncbi:unnamed protein product [Boreogadus saida]
MSAYQSSVSPHSINLIMSSEVPQGYFPVATVHARVNLGDGLMGCCDDLPSQRCALMTVTGASGGDGDDRCAPPPVEASVTKDHHAALLAVFHSEFANRIIFT